MTTRTQQDGLEKPLSENDMAALLRELSPISPRLILNFGVQLQLSRTIIETLDMQLRSQERVENILRKILNEALRHYPPLTRRDIVRALRDPSVQEDRLACDIEAKYQPSPETVGALQQGVNLAGYSVPSTAPQNASSLQHSCFAGPQPGPSMMRVASIYPSPNSQPVSQSHQLPYQPYQNISQQLPSHYPIVTSQRQTPQYRSFQWIPRQRPYLNPQANRFPYSHHFPSTHQPFMQGYPPEAASQHPPYPPYPGQHLQHYQCSQSPRNLHQFPTIVYQSESDVLSTTINSLPPPHHSPAQYPLAQPTRPLSASSSSSLPPSRPPSRHEAVPSQTAPVFDPPAAKRHRRQSPELPRPPPLFSEGPSSSQATSPNLTPVEEFIEFVKLAYMSKTVEKDVKFSLSPTKAYINLALIDRRKVEYKEYKHLTNAMVQDGNVDAIQNKKGKIKLSEIASGIPVPSSTEVGENVDDRRLILVEGAPGVGKSTFAWEFCRRWLKRKVARQYDLVLLLRLRDERIRNAKSVRDLLYCPSEDVSQAVFSELVYSNRYNVLIILEGFDELPDNCRNDPLSVFNELISGKLLPLASVLVTSRPWATKHIRKKHENRIYQHIEVLGFTKRQIKDYINDTVAEDQVSDLTSYLERHPQIRSGMYIPLNCAIVVAVYTASKKGQQPLPKTLTELYSSLVEVLIGRHMESHPELEGDSRKCLPSLNLSVPCEVHRNIIHLSEIAYSGIIGKSDGVKLIFSESELPQNFDNLGFMDSVTDLYVTQQTASSHNFLHLTFQEFFAAVHISQMPPEQQVEYYKQNVGNERGRLRVVLRFLAGLQKLNCFTKETVTFFSESSSLHVESRYESLPNFSIGIDVVNWMFEAQSNSVISLVLGESKVEFEAAKSDMLPMDYYSLGYCISHSQCEWVLSLTGKMILSKKKITILAKGATGAVSSGRIVRLGDSVLSDLTDTSLLFKEWNCLLRIHHLSLNYLRLFSQIAFEWHHLDLSSLRVIELRTYQIHSWCLPQSLYLLSIDGGVLKDSACLNVANYLSSTTCLKEFTLKCSMLEQNAQPITKALATNQSLPLERLELQSISLTETDVENLIHFLNNAKSLQYVSITKCRCVSHRLLQLVQTLEHNSTVQEKVLNECMCYIAADCDVNALSQLHHSYSLVLSRRVNQSFVDFIGTGKTTIADIMQQKIVNLSGCRILSGDDTIIRLAQALHHNSTLTSLDMSRNNIGDDGAVALAQALNHNSTLTTLILSTNRIGDDGAVALGQALHHNSTLTSLDLSGNRICDDGATTIAQALLENSTLKSLDLSTNRICDDGAVALGQALHHNSTLTSLSLSTNRIGSDGIVALALHHNSTLTSLDLSENRICDDGAVALAQALIHNSTLTTLDFSDNSIGDDGAVALAQALHHNSTLTSLDSSGSSIGDDGAVALAQALHHNSTLTSLDLSRNRIGDGGAVALAQALHHNSTLTTLDLNWNSIGYDGAVALAQALHHNSTLTSLDLSVNSIGGDGAVALAQALHHNSTLTKLDLIWNSIGGNGAIALAQALHHNSTLTTLDLSRNRIGGDGAVTLAQALHHNSTLISLDLSENSIGDDGAVALARSLSHSCLQQLSLYGNDGIGDRAACQFILALTQNSSICDRNGLTLPHHCKQYATNSQHYHLVRQKISFR